MAQRGGALGSLGRKGNGNLAKGESYPRPDVWETAAARINQGKVPSTSGARAPELLWDGEITEQTGTQTSGPICPSRCQMAISMTMISKLKLHLMGLVP